jgi:hypothetical protein
MLMQRNHPPGDGFTSERPLALQRDFLKAVI